MTHDHFKHDRWATRYGLIMAMAGNAVGLGNFLRFPAKAEPYGLAFLVPYFIALALLGIPLMWMEWAMGRRGGMFGHGSTPGMFHRLWPHPISKYLGIFGILLPAAIGLYYVYIESWSLGYAWKTAVGDYWGTNNRDGMRETFTGYLGMNGGTLSFGYESYVFFLITLGLNLLVFSRGIRKGVEIVAKYAMPVLLILGIVLAIRVFTLPSVEGRNSIDGFAHMWRVDWSALGNANVWLDATGQIFFTLSLGFGMIQTYASYLGRDDDIVLNGLSTCGMNEFVEVILGGAIVVPAAVIFFGPVMTSQIVSGGTFDIGFYTLPVIFQEIPAGRLFGTMWFVLLFLAGLTSSVAMFTPLLLFVTQELKVERGRAIKFISVGIFLLMQPVVLFMHRGVLDELDYWAGTFLLVVFAAFEAVVFAWCFGMRKGWDEIHHGASIRVPRVYYPIMQFITPAFVIGLLVWWCTTELWPKLTMEGVDAANKPYLWATRVGLILGAALLVWGVRHVWHRAHWSPDPALEPKRRA